jgi:hypothetical protein
LNWRKKPTTKDTAGGRLSALYRDVSFGDGPNKLSRRTCDDHPQLATTLQPWITGDDDHEGLRTAICGLHDEHQVRHLPRASQLPSIPGLPPLGPRGAVRTRVSIDRDKLMPMTTLGRRSSPAFSSGAAFLVVGTIAAAWTVYFVLASWPPAMDFAVAPSSASSETQFVPLSPLPQAILPSGGEAAPEPQLTMLSEDKPTKNGIEARSSETLPASDYRATGQTSAMPGSSSVHQASPKSGADAALDVQDTKPLIERERLVYPAAGVQVSTCFPSASAVRQSHPEAWPSWTLRAAGHEGTKCWYPATRATAGDHRGETIAKKETPLGE